MRDTEATNTMLENILVKATLYAVSYRRLSKHKEECETCKKSTELDGYCEEGMSFFTTTVFAHQDLVGE